MPADRLPLEDAARTVVYTMVVAALRNDPVLKRVVGVGGWRVYLGDDGDVIDPASGNLPMIEILPFGFPSFPESPTTQGGNFGLTVNVSTEGLDVRNVLNLWGAVEGALFKGDGGRSLNNAIRDAISTPKYRCHLETINLGDPAMTPTMANPNRLMWTATGTITVLMLVKK